MNFCGWTDTVTSVQVARVHLSSPVCHQDVSESRVTDCYGDGSADRLFSGILDKSLAVSADGSLSSPHPETSGQEGWALKQSSFIFLSSPTHKALPFYFYFFKVSLLHKIKCDIRSTVLKRSATFSSSCPWSIGVYPDPG